jgi:peptidoglycan hydrolase-like protein with peptidoglycan-binding domain
MNLESLKEFATQANTPPWEPVRPDIYSAQSQGGGKSGNQSPAPAPTPKKDPIVEQVQKALQKEMCAGCRPKNVDGINGPDTKAAIEAYQRSKGLNVNGDPKDPAVLKALGIPDPAMQSKGEATKTL